ncbi:MAG: type II secretion system GspH family protein [Lachnospiraceae bacterium]|nr:type II secretion system GspH family protein [Lachnospiraceae bacterium]
MKKMKNDNKGFTLVELIVVLVILAILAAILVPALLGYIDEAKASQLELHGKSVYTAAQAVSSELYGKGVVPTDETANTVGNKSGKVYLRDRIFDISDLDEFKADVVTVTVGFKGTTKHDAYTVSYLFYSEKVGTADPSCVELVGGSWSTCTAASVTTNTVTFTYTKGSDGTWTKA